MHKYTAQLISRSLVGLAAILLASCSSADSESQCSNLVSIKSELPEVVQVAATATDWKRSLSDDSLGNALYCLGHQEMYIWSNLPPPRSGGLPLSDMSEEQQQLAWATLNAFLSESAQPKIKFLATEIEEASGAGPADAYTFSLYGDPEVDGIWGFQFDGHHIALNFLVHASDVILAPLFLGSQPLSIDGYMPLESEYQLGRDLINRLPAELKVRAERDGLVRRDVFVGAGRRHVDTNRDFDYSEFDQVGVAIQELGDSEVSLLEQLTVLYLSNLAEPFAAKTIQHLLPTLSEGYFVYSTRGDRVYYRIYVPDHLLIEYSDVRSDHIHTITRFLGTELFNDYGSIANIDSNAAPTTLAEHYQLAAHHQELNSF